MIQVRSWACNDYDYSLFVKTDSESHAIDYAMDYAKKMGLVNNDELYITYWIR